MQDILLEINKCVDKYNSLNDELTFKDVEKLSSILKNLSSNLFFLEKYRNQYHDKYNSIMNESMIKGLAFNKSELMAKNEVPELYMLRRLMTSAYKVTDNIRTNISHLKNER